MRLTLILLVVGARIVSAQSPPMRALDLATPLRARATIPELSSRPIAGRVERVDSNGLGLTITDYGTTLRVPWGKAAAVERSIGRNPAASAVRGLLIGAAAGAAIYATQVGYARRSAEPGWSMLGLEVLSVVIAPGSGALIGMASARERWETVIDAPRTAGGSIDLALATSDEIKVRTEHGEIVGRVSDVSRDSLFVGARRIAWSDVTGAKLRGGRNRKQGAFWGGVGLAGIAIYSEIRQPTLRPRERPAAFAADFALGALFGSLFLGGKGWVEIPVRGLRPVKL